jgi:hypothetical protein
MKRLKTLGNIDGWIDHLASALVGAPGGNLVERLRMEATRATRRHAQPALVGVAALLMLHCSGEDATTTTAQPEPGGAANQETAGGPRTIYEVLDRINELPHPVQLTEFLESLPRPLAVNANFNAQSAQPALGKRSPRIFIIVERAFSMSLVPGAAAATLEFGERDASGLRSVKGEVHFPVEAPLAPEDAFVRLAPDASTGLTLDQGTLCGSCHNNEAPAPDYPFRGAFSSEILKPTPFFAVDVAAMRQEHDACDAAAEPERCSVFQAIFDHGDVVQAPFL